MLPFLTFVAVAAAFMGMLNSLHRFFIPALSPAMFNVATIICALTLVPLMPALGLPAITAIAIGTLVGGVAQLALQWPSLRREGFTYRPILDWKDESLRRVLVLMGPGTIGLAATQVNVFVNTVLATGEGTGAVSWLNYAFRLMYLPIGLFGVSIATATLPAVSRHVAVHDEGAARRTVADGLSLMLMLNVPATVGLMVLAPPIVRVIFERGAFTAVDTAATAAALQFYAIGLVGYSVVRIASPVFYALGQNRTPVMVSVATVLVNAVLNICSWASWDTAAWRSARRSPRSSTRRCSCSCFGGGSAASRAAGSLRRWCASRSLRRSWARGGRASTWERVCGCRALGSRRSSSGLARPSRVAMVVLAAAAYLLRIREFREAVALVTRKLRIGRR